MRDHDLDIEGGPAEGRARRDDREAGAPAGLLGSAAAAGRAGALQPGDVLRLQALAGNDGVRGLVQRAAEAGSVESAVSVDGAGVVDPEASVAEVLRRPGQPLAPVVRHDMESALGHDFGDVRVHTDAAAATSAQAVQAQAYTVGSHVVFGEGRFQPGSTEGRRTLAHELTHVVQQRRGPVDGTPPAVARRAGDGGEGGAGLRVSDPGDPFEQEAEAVADQVVQRTTTPRDTPAGTTDTDADDGRPGDG